MFNHPTLYAKATNGKILSWRIEQDADKYRTVSGYIDGQQVTSEYTLEQLKKDVLNNESATMSEINDAGYYRIWDCGESIYEIV